MKRIRINCDEDRIEVNDKVYDLLDEELGPYIGMGKPTHKRAILTKLMVSEVVDNFFPSKDWVKDYDKEFTQIVLLVHVSENEEARVELTHDGNDFDPFADDSPCEKIKLCRDEIGFRKKPDGYGSCEPKKGFKLKYKLTESEGE